jgi:hypothetical protein|tara:strand:+ start:274 stop:774 length:501 start_codon:yes stop_codon:yes gene_type:complete
MGDIINHPSNTKPHAKMMLSNFSRLRYINPLVWDRVFKLTNYTTIDEKVARHAKLGLTAVNVTRSRTKFDEIMEKLERHMVKQSKFNMKVSNIPNTGFLSDTEEETKIGYNHMRATFGQFGIVNDLILVQGTAYVQYTTSKDSRKTVGLINNMQMGNKILKATTTF